MKRSFPKISSALSFSLLAIGLLCAVSSQAEQTTTTTTETIAPPAMAPAPTPPSAMMAPAPITPPAAIAPQAPMVAVPVNNNPAPPPAAGPVGGPVEFSPSPEETKTITTTTVTTEQPVAPPAPKPAPKKKPVKKAKKVTRKPEKKMAKGMPASMRNRSEAAAPVELPQIHRSLHDLFPAENVQLQSVNNSVVITGTVSDLQTSHRIVEVVEQYVNKDESKRSGSEITRVVNMMQIRTNQQVMLRVRIGEIKRTATKGFGLLTLNDLERDGLFKVLAEPNLVAISGETANFLSGGEFPVPVTGAQGGTTVQYKNYGIGLQFTPIVLSQNRIRLVVASEVSELSKAGSIESNGFDIPSLAARRAKTTVELAPGESYMIAGLLKDNMKIKTGEVTGLGEIPLIGPLLFRDSTTKHDETELVIAVTPYLVDPVRGSDIRLPSDDFRAPSQMETIMFGALGSLSDTDKVQLQNPKAEGAYGFMTE